MVPETKYHVGIDIGSTASKTVVLQGGEVVDSFVLPTGWNGRETAQEIHQRLEKDGYADAMRCVATGYGRVCVDYADKVVTEITCHGKGGWSLFEKNVTIIDVGGQDTKVIKVAQGQVTDFLMNDKCAAGTGKFIEIMANRLGATLEELYQLAEEGEPLSISAMCTVFAESEVISHIGMGKKREDIAAGVIHSVATRVSGLASRFGISGDVALTGGLCDSPYFIRILSEKLERPVQTHPFARYAGALGAALTAEGEAPMIYLDSSATSFLKPPQVAEAVCRAFTTVGNAGRGAHAATLGAARMIYDTREKLADLFHIPDPSRICFTSNATEALNIAIQGLICEKDHVITTACEHNSVLRPLYAKERAGAGLSILPADEKGRIAYEKLEEFYQENTRAVVITHASNLTGNVTDLAKIRAFTRRHDLLLILDASQTAGALAIDVEEMGIDVLCFTGHKGLLGPQGTGGIYVREGIAPVPLKVGGSGVHSFEKEHPADMPTALEAGTLNGHGIAGLNAALDFLKETGIGAIHQKEDALARRFAKGVSKIPAVVIYGDLEADVRAPIVSLNIGEMDSAMVSDILWEDYEICVRAGAHCAPLMHEALGTVEQGAVRFSFSYFNTEEDVDAAIDAVGEIAKE